MKEARSFTLTEKQEIKNQQLDKDGTLRCFISNEIIDESNNDYEYDHITPYSKNGSTVVSNGAIVLKKHNRSKGTKSLQQARDNYNLEKLYISKNNNVNLQDVFRLKDIKRNIIQIKIESDKVTIFSDYERVVFNLLYDPILKVDYFYGRMPICWIENDDTEGLQPRLIDKKKLIELRDNLAEHPQLMPSIARLVGKRIYSFDGQHKLAGQVLNDLTHCDVKIYISPDDKLKEKILFDQLMTVNLDAHSKFKQTPFHTSTLLNRYSAIGGSLFAEYLTNDNIQIKNEIGFYEFISNKKDKKQAKEIMESVLIDNIIKKSPLTPYIAKASKDRNFPITNNLLSEHILPHLIYNGYSESIYDSLTDYREAETNNFNIIANMIIEEGFLKKWVYKPKQDVSNIELKARRIWHSGSVMTWGVYLHEIMCYTLHLTGKHHRSLYREGLDKKEIDCFQQCLRRLFSHKMWDSPVGELDNVLSGSKKATETFNNKGLTTEYVLGK